MKGEAEVREGILKAVIREVKEGKGEGRGKHERVELWPQLMFMC